MSDPKQWTVRVLENGEARDLERILNNLFDEGYYISHIIGRNFTTQWIIATRANPKK